MSKGKGGSRSGRGGFAGAVQGPFGGSLLIIMGAVALLACLIAFVIVVGQVDTSYTSAGSYTEQSGLQQSMGMLPMIFFIFFMALGLGGVVGGTVKNVIAAKSGGDWMGILSAIMGAVTAVIILILNDLIQSQLHVAYVAVNATVNKASFAGVLGIMGIWGMVILWTLIGSIFTQVGFGVYGSYKKISGKG